MFDNLINNMEAVRFKEVAQEEEVQQVMYVDVLPITALNQNAPVEFVVPGSGAQYINLKNTQLYVKCHITLGNGQPIPPLPLDDDLGDLKEESLVSVTNNFLNSLWRQVDVFFGDKMVSSSGLSYPYKSYIDTLLNTGMDAKQSQLQAQMYIKDTASYMDDTNNYLGANEGVIARSKFFEESRPVDMEGPLSIDLFRSESPLLLNGVDLKLKLWPSTPQFALLSSAGIPDFKVVLDKVYLKVCKVNPSPSIYLENEKLLQKTTAKYPYMKADITTRSMERDQTSLTIENLYQGRIPAKLCVGIVGTRNYHGSYSKNPFNFLHADVIYMAAYVNGIAMPGMPFEPKFDVSTKTGLYVREYLSTFGIAGKLNADAGNFIDRLDYPAGYTLYCFDIDPEAQFTLKKQTGSFKLDIRLGKGAGEHLTVILYALYPEIIEIDKARNVIVQ